MAGANPQRTSWVATSSGNVTQITGQLKPLWYRPLRSYVATKIQPVVAEDQLYVSSSNGLYALNTENGDIAWVFPTELPLGHSPTVWNGVVYVGGMDRNLYALPARPSNLPTDATTGYKVNSPLKTFTATDDGPDLAAGFETNPLVANNLVIIGNRNGILYAIYSNDYPESDKRLTLAWKHKTGGAIRYSAAYSRSNNTIYVGSMDGFAYAINAADGVQVWKSARLPGAGFYSFWPVVFENYVVFSGSHHYLYDKGVANLAPFGGAPDTYQHLENIQLMDLGATVGGTHGPLVTPPAEWPSGSKVVRADTAINYQEAHPERRRYFVLNQSDGNEMYFDLDNDGSRDYPPFCWYGTHSGTRYPPIIGPDGTHYSGTIYTQGDYISAGQVAGWKFNTPLLRLLFNSYNNIDEPFQWSMGGDVIYTHQFYGSVGSSVNISTINNEWIYYGYESPNQLRDIAPGYSVQNQKVNSEYESTTFSPPIPYKGKVFVLHGSGIIAFTNTSSPANSPLPVAEIVSCQTSSRVVSRDQLIQRLEAEILKFDIDNNGTLDHLRPGYHSQGLGDLSGNDAVHNPETYMAHYFHNPADTMTTLLATLPYLSAATQEKVRTYLNYEYDNFNPCDYSHIGWKEGARREAYEELPEFSAVFLTFDKINGDFESYWDLPPQAYYALWKYAQEFGHADQVFNRNGYGICKSRLSTPPADSFLLDYPYILNDYLVGYTGYVELANLAGETPSQTIVNTLAHLKDIRVNQFQIDAPAWPPPPVGQGMYKTILSASRNFIGLSRELGSYMDNANAGSHTLMQNAVKNYQESIPYWFVSKFEGTSGEGVLQQLFDYQAIFQAKAWVLQQPAEELSKYLDVPAFERGDLFYIQNLVAVIEKLPAAQAKSNSTCESCAHGGCALGIGRHLR